MRAALAEAEVREEMMGAFEGKMNVMEEEFSRRLATEVSCLAETGLVNV